MTPAATVYLATNMLNGHTYVGVTRFTPEQRWAKHVRSSHSAKTYLHRAIAKYGQQKFRIDSVASCLRAEEAASVEREVIRRLRPVYNQTDGGEITRGRRFSIETRRKISLSNIGKHARPHTQEEKDKIGHAHRGRIVSPETRIRLSLAMIGKRPTRTTQGRTNIVKALIARNKACVWTEARRAKLSAACMGRIPDRATMQAMWRRNQRRVVCYTNGMVFDSVKSAAQYCGVSASAISNVCAGRYALVRGFGFYYEG